MRRIALTALVGLAALPGCGDGEESGGQEQPPARTAPARDAPKEKDAAAPARAGTEIVLGDSEYGSMLFDAKRQAI